MTEFTQAADRFEAMSEKEQEILADNIAESLLFTGELVRETVLGHFGNVSPELEKILRKRFSF
ncbi:hypothetical protein NE619_04385 [Anaerovorax odorimutans]|uniref:Catalase immune-responsive domain-containing protein n=1 Tax=Anaerovorax odorimutans TaxID=109327 RepID=A0ABT1RL96_9FIRM|nr:catalase-related domain-containing protein [Anaerovorax odorimutans]MCQ4635954.1 hypothetical protein [Anaerovorax odorimutans]